MFYLYTSYSMHESDQKQMYRQPNCQKRIRNEEGAQGSRPNEIISMESRERLSNLSLELQSCDELANGACPDSSG